MRLPELYLRSAPFLAAGLAAVWASGKIVATAWASLAAEAGLERPTADAGPWLWWIVAVLAVMATLWTARRLRDTLRARRVRDGVDEPALWI